MKTKLLSSILVAGLFIASCSKETTLLDRDTEMPQGNALTFLLPSTKKATTRDAASHLKTDQREDTIANLVVYMFERSGAFLEAYTFTGSDITTANATTRRVIVPIAPHYTGEKHFYFLANVPGATERQVGDQIISFSYYEAAFVKLKQTLDAGVLTYDPVNNTALPMYGKSTDPDSGAEINYVRVKDVANPGLPTVNLVRTVARFDIANDAATTGFTVDSIAIVRAKKEGLIYPVATPDQHCAFMDSYVRIPKVSASANSTTDIYQSKPEFYIFPTNLNTDSTQIQIKGHLTDGKAIILSAKAPGQPDAPNYTYDDIVRNRLYIIHIRKTDVSNDQFTVNITIRDWEDNPQMNTTDDYTMSIMEDITEVVPDGGVAGTYTVATAPSTTDTYTNTATPKDKPTKLKVKYSSTGTWYQPISGVYKDGVTYTVSPPTFVATPKPHYEGVLYIEFSDKEVTGNITINRNVGGGPALRTITVNYKPV